MLGRLHWAIYHIACLRKLYPHQNLIIHPPSLLLLHRPSLRWSGWNLVIFLPKSPCPHPTTSPYYCVSVYMFFKLLATFFPPSHARIIMQNYPDSISETCTFRGQARPLPSASQRAELCTPTTVLHFHGPRIYTTYNHCLLCRHSGRRWGNPGRRCQRRRIPGACAHRERHKPTVRVATVGRSRGWWCGCGESRVDNEENNNGLVCIVIVTTLTFLWSISIIVYWMLCLNK